MRQVREKSNPPLALTTRGRAHRTWRTLEARLEAVRQEVQKRYLQVLQTAPDNSPVGPPALLRAASVLVTQPLDADTLRLRQRLVHAFALFGTSLWRQPPASLRLDILEYADRIEVLCRRGRKLSQRLQLAREILQFLQKRGPGRRSHLIRLTLTDPEAMRLSLLLAERQTLARQSNEVALRESCLARIATCHTWLALLGMHLPAEHRGEIQTALAAVAAPLDSPSDQSSSLLTDAHVRLDQISRRILSSLEETTSAPS